MKFVSENALILVPVIYGLGMFLKSLEFIKDKYIPSILLITSLIFTPFYLGSFTDPTNYVQAILVATSAVFVNQLIKQVAKGE